MSRQKNEATKLTISNHVAFGIYGVNYFSQTPKEMQAECMKWVPWQSHYSMAQVSRSWNSITSTLIVRERYGSPSVGDGMTCIHKILAEDCLILNWRSNGEPERDHDNRQTRSGRRYAQPAPAGPWKKTSFRFPPNFGTLPRGLTYSAGTREKVCGNDDCVCITLSKDDIQYTKDSHHFKPRTHVGMKKCPAWRESLVWPPQAKIVINPLFLILGWENFGERDLWETWPDWIDLDLVATNGVFVTVQDLLYKLWTKGYAESLPPIGIGFELDVDSVRCVWRINDDGKASLDCYFLDWSLTVDEEQHTIVDRVCIGDKYTEWERIKLG